MLKHLISCLLLLAFSAPFAFGDNLQEGSRAKPYVLFDATRGFVDRYDVLVNSLREGDWISFGDAEPLVQLEGYLGGGTNTRIFKVQGQALRLPKYADFFTTADWFDAAVRFRRAKLPVPEMDLRKSKRGYWMFVELLNSEGDLEDYVRELNDIGPVDIEKFEQLKQFLRVTAHVTDVGDFELFQLAYTQRRGWVLLDFSDFSETAFYQADPENHFVLNMIKNILSDKKLVRSLADTVAEARASSGIYSSACMRMAAAMNYLGMRWLPQLQPAQAIPQ